MLDPLASSRQSRGGSSAFWSHLRVCNQGRQLLQFHQLYFKNYTYQLDCRFSKHVNVYFVSQSFHSLGIQKYNCKSEIKYINCIGFGFSYKHSPPLTP